MPQRKEKIRLEMGGGGLVEYLHCKMPYSQIFKLKFFFKKRASFFSLQIDLVILVKLGQPFCVIEKHMAHSTRVMEASV